MGGTALAMFSFRRNVRLYTKYCTPESPCGATVRGHVKGFGQSSLGITFVNTEHGQVVGRGQSWTDVIQDSHRSSRELSRELSRFPTTLRIVPVIHA
jgi:hypothetical protein